jgi:cytochrome P450
LGPYQQWRIYYEPREAYSRLRVDHGGVASVHFQGEDRAVILTAEAARQVLAVPASNYDAFWKESFGDIAGQGSIWVFDGERHRAERHLLSPAFHAARFRGWGETFQEIARRETVKWQPGQTIKAVDTTVAIAREIILRVVLGLEGEAQLEQGRRILSPLYQLHPLTVFFRPMRRQWFPPWARFVRGREVFARWIQKLVAERQTREAASADALTYLLSARYEDGSPIGIGDLADELATILLSGYETTGAALAWALYELGRNPQVLHKLRAELAPLGPDPDPEALIKLPYLNAVCNETLRLHTILAEIGRIPNAPIEVQGYDIPAGRPIVVGIIAIHLDPQVYPEPDRFLPERFLDRTYSSSEFMPFGGGHRRCLGASLAQMEMPLILAEIVTHWEFEPAAIEREVRQNISMCPRNGVRLRITGRREALPSSGISRPEAVAVPL